mmetsp:Transcript_31000/g.61890  ORF Transcript_31000/g.61890 Transcript_31000/m.61890 type:complete len:329 (-) Transcript_31000:2-988(-)
MSRAAETLSKIPLATFSIIAICCLVYIYQFLFDPNLQQFTMCPRLVIYLNEYYRFITSSLFHGSMMHIGMNMMSTMAIGSSLEKQVGSFTMGFTILWGILLTSTIYTGVSWLLYLMFDYERMMYQHSVGFSGVIFQLSVLETNLNPNRMRSVFGFFQVSSKMYPWALLVILQFIMPQISFLGHLSGVLVGTLQLHGAFDSIFPSDSYINELENWETLQLITTKPGFIRLPETGNGLRRANNAGLVASLLAAFGFVVQFVKNVCETIHFCIFGRGSDANENIQMRSIGAALGYGDSTSGSGAMQQNLEDEWAGLPTVEEAKQQELLNLL